MLFPRALGRGKASGGAAKLKGNPCEEETLNRVLDCNFRQISSGFGLKFPLRKSDHDLNSKPWNISLGCILTLQIIKSRLGSV